MSEMNALVQATFTVRKAHEIIGGFRTKRGIYEVTKYT